MTGSTDEPWDVRWGSSALRSLDRLPQKVATAVVEFVTSTLPEDPMRMSKPLRFELEGWRVARRGSYRVIFRLVDDRTILVGRVQHRADVYHRH